MRAYLDTCIVSGLAKRDFKDDDATAVVRILEAHKRGTLELVTSEVTSREIDKAPAEHRAKHEVIYLLLANVPAVPMQRLSVEMHPVVGPAFVAHDEPLFATLIALGLDANDARHTFQAAQNKVNFLITVDRRFVSRSVGSPGTELEFAL